MVGVEQVGEALRAFRARWLWWALLGTVAVGLAMGVGLAIRPAWKPDASVLTGEKALAYSFSGVVGVTVAAILLCLALDQMRTDEFNLRAVGKLGRVLPSILILGLMSGACSYAYSEAMRMLGPEAVWVSYWLYTPLSIPFIFVIPFAIDQGRSIRASVLASVRTVFRSLAMVLLALLTFVLLIAASLLPLLCVIIPMGYPPNTGTILVSLLVTPLLFLFMCVWYPLYYLTIAALYGRLVPEESELNHNGTAAQR